MVVVAGGIGLAPLRPALYHLLEHRGDGDVLAFERLEVNQLAELLVPMFDVAAIDNRADACDDPARTTRAKGRDVEVCREQAAA